MVMSVAGSFRPGHTEREVLRDYVVGKTVEEVVVSRKAQLVMGGRSDGEGAWTRHGHTDHRPGTRDGGQRGRHFAGLARRSAFCI